MYLCQNHHLKNDVITLNVKMYAYNALKCVCVCVCACVCVCVWRGGGGGGGSGCISLWVGGWINIGIFNDCEVLTENSGGERGVGASVCGWEDGSIKESLMIVRC